MDGIEDVLQAICTGFIGPDNTIQILPQSWRNAVAKSLDSISRIMNRLVPISVEMELYWEKHYGSELIIDIETSEIYEKLPLDSKWFVAQEKKLADEKRLFVIHDFF